MPSCPCWDRYSSYIRLALTRLLVNCDLSLSRSCGGKTKRPCSACWCVRSMAMYCRSQRCLSLRGLRDDVQLTTEMSEVTSRNSSGPLSAATTRYFGILSCASRAAAASCRSSVSSRGRSSSATWANRVARSGRECQRAVLHPTCCDVGKMASQSGRCGLKSSQ
jgi:hypothetical protein